MLVCEKIEIYNNFVTSEDDYKKYKRIINLGVEKKWELQNQQIK